MVVRFPAYNDFESSRIATNDAAMALLVSTRLAEVALRGLSPEHAEEHLPQAFPGLEHAQRLNRKAPDALRLILDAERQLTYMAIPFALTVYETFGKDAIRLMRAAGLDGQTTDVSIFKLSKLHNYLLAIGIPLPAPELELFDFIRQVRNRIVHQLASKDTTLRRPSQGWAKAPKAFGGSWLEVILRSVIQKASSSSKLGT